MIKVTREMAIAAVGFLVGIVVTKLKQHHMTDDDRPTIRVRNGSMMVEVDKPGSFGRASNSTPNEWLVLGGRRKVHALLVTFNGKDHYTDRVTVNYVQGANSGSVTLGVVSDRTEITIVGGPVLPIASPRRRKALKVNGNWRIDSVQLAGDGEAEDGEEAPPIKAKCTGQIVEIEQLEAEEILFARAEYDKISE